MSTHTVDIVKGGLTLRCECEYDKGEPSSWNGLKGVGHPGSGPYASVVKVLIIFDQNDHGLGEGVDITTALQELNCLDELDEPALEVIQNHLERGTSREC